MTGVRKIFLVWLVAIALRRRGHSPRLVAAAEIQMQVQAAPATPVRYRRRENCSPSKTRCGSVWITIRGSNRPVNVSCSQQAVLGQQMSAYYPTVTFTNLYQTCI